MSKKTPTVTLTILNKDYIIACPPEEQNSLLNTAQQLNAKMRRLHDSGKVTGTDRVAVMAALNLAHELEIGKQQASVVSDPDLVNKLISLRHKIENILENPEN
ncbi:MAG: cell division protein ZapA [Methylococcaceae bacterium]|nr:cell division protein ZapA [Methylococcaceae bacterium]